METTHTHPGAQCSQREITLKLELSCPYDLGIIGRQIGSKYAIPVAAVAGESADRRAAMFSTAFACLEKNRQVSTGSQSSGVQTDLMEPDRKCCWTRL
jgi:hypothetical protein